MTPTGDTHVTPTEGTGFTREQAPPSTSWSHFLHHRLSVTSTGPSALFYSPRTSLETWLRVEKQKARRPRKGGKECPTLFYLLVLQHLGSGAMAEPQLPTWATVMSWCVLERPSPPHLHQPFQFLRFFISFKKNSINTTSGYNPHICTQPPPPPPQPGFTPEPWLP